MQGAMREDQWVQLPVGRSNSVNIRILLIDGLLSVRLPRMQHVSIQDPWSE
jgi:hypothetical protein